MDSVSYDKVNSAFNLTSISSTVYAFFFYKTINQLYCSLKYFCYQLSKFVAFLTFLLLLTTSQQFISFNEISATDKHPAAFFVISIVAAVIYAVLGIFSAFIFCFTHDIYRQLNRNRLICIHLVYFLFYLMLQVLLIF